MLKKTKTKEQLKSGYQKPEIIKAEKMIFMFEPYKKGGSIIACRQCSSCHGCR